MLKLTRPLGTVLLLLCILFIKPVPLYADTTPTDSLKALLKTEKDIDKRCESYVHLADLQPSADAWEKVMQEAVKAKNEHVLRIALNELTSNGTRKYAYYLEIADKELKGPGKELFISGLRCMNIWMRLSTEENMQAIIGKELERIKQQAKPLNKEKEIEWEFITALNIDCATVSDNYGADITRAIPHVEHAMALLQQYPLEQRYHFEMICHQKLTNLYTVNADTAIARKGLAEIKKMLSLYRQYTEWSKTVLKRPFRNDDFFYLKINSLPLYMYITTKEEAKEYYRKCMEIIERNPKLGQQHKRVIYSLLGSYYVQIGDYDRAIASNDSLIAYEKANSRPVDLISPLMQNAFCYEQTGDYKNAFHTLVLADSLQQSVNMEEARKNTDEMQARFNVNKLELERTQLIAHNRLVILYAASIFLLCLIAWITYLIHTMRKLHKTQKELLQSNEEIIRQKAKVMESEEMKTCFIQSMCHEIRTPLNAINGFSGLLLEDSIDDKEKDDFPRIIQENIDSLIGILDNMLEASVLVTSNDPLPIEETCIDPIYSDATQDKADLISSSGLTFKQDIAQGYVIRTNYRYLTKVISQLLENALKFTETGSITFSCQPDEKRHLLVIAVADTGIGIAPDKQEWIFERFTKVDSFKPGVGVGLYLSRIIITRLGGKIYIDREYTAGCRIVIELPLQDS